LLVAHLQAIEARETARGRADRIAWLNTAPPEVAELAEFNRLRAAVYSLRPKGLPALEQLVALAQGGRPLHPGAPPAQAPAKPTIEELEKLYRARATLPKGRPSAEWQERRKQIDAELLANLGKK
jgi:hypothetical protein